MDYFYAVFHQAHIDGTPVLHPFWFKYPKDTNTFPIEHQFFFGDSILVSPVTADDATSVSIYLPPDTFYDFATLAPVQGQGTNINLSNFTTIPLHIKGRTILPLRNESAMTTTALRAKDIEFVVAQDANGRATGKLYLDDGESIAPLSSTQVAVSFTNGMLVVSGRFGYATCVNVSRVRFLGVGSVPRQVYVNGKVVKNTQFAYNTLSKVLDVAIGEPFVKGFSVQYNS